MRPLPNDLNAFANPEVHHVSTACIRFNEVRLSFSNVKKLSQTETEKLLNNYFSPYEAG